MTQLQKSEKTQKAKYEFFTKLQKKRKPKYLRYGS